MRILILTLLLTNCFNLMSQEYYFEDPTGEIIKPFFDSTLTETWSEWKVDENWDYGGTTKSVDSLRWKNKDNSTLSEHRMWIYSNDSTYFYLTILDYTNQKLIKREQHKKQNPKKLNNW